MCYEVERKLSKKTGVGRRVTREWNGNRREALDTGHEGQRWGLKLGLRLSNLPCAISTKKRKC